jgi:hypothetical protein
MMMAAKLGQPLPRHREMSELPRVEVTLNRRIGCYVLKLPKGWRPYACEYFVREDEVTHVLTFTAGREIPEDLSLIGTTRIRRILSKSVSALVAVLIAGVLEGINRLLSWMTGNPPDWIVTVVFRAILYLDLFGLVWFAIDEQTLGIINSRAGSLIVRVAGSIAKHLLGSYKERTPRTPK